MRARLLAGLALAAVVGAVFVLRPLAYGIPLGTVAVFWTTVVAQVVAPGVLLCRGAGLCAASDRWLLAGQGATVGLTLHGLSFLAGRATGLPWLSTAVSLAVSAVGLALGARARSTPARRGQAEVLRPRGSFVVLAVVLVACVVQPLFTVRLLGEPVPVDLLWHAGNAAELRHRWPLEDPRVAGLPLNYYLLAYALPVEVSARTGGATADVLLGLAPLFWIALLALQLANAGRALVRDAGAGAVGAAVALLHADPGRLLGLGPGAFASHLATGIYGSPTTVCGLILLASLAVALDDWMEVGRAPRIATVGLLAAGASAAKTSVLPVVVGAAALALTAALLGSRSGEAKRWAAAMAVAAGAGAPLWQASGGAIYPGLVEWTPWAAFEASPFAAAVARRVGPGASLGAWALPAFVAWFVGYLGLAGVGAAAWLGLRREPLRAIQAWALAVAAVGAVLALTFNLPGFSQLFMLYNGLLLLCLFAGASLVLAARRLPGRPLAFTGLVLCALPSVEGLVRTLPAGARATAFAATREPGPALSDFVAGLEWLRTHAAADGVVFADDPSFLLSALGEVRLYYENGLYTARGLGDGGSGEPFPERAGLQERLLRHPDAAAVAEARRALGRGPRLLVVADFVQSRVEAGLVIASVGPIPSRALLPNELFTRRFGNGTMHVYEAREDDPGR